MSSRENVPAWAKGLKAGTVLLTRGGAEVVVLEKELSETYCWVRVKRIPEGCHEGAYSVGKEYNIYLPNPSGRGEMEVVGTFDDYLFSLAMAEVDAIAPGWGPERDVV